MKRTKNKCLSNKFSKGGICINKINTFNTITKSRLIKEIVNNLNGKISQNDVLMVLDSLEDICIYHLKQATVDHPVIIKLMNGLRIQSKLLPEEKVNTFNGEFCIRTECFKTDAKFTRYFNRRILNDLNC